MDGGGIRGIIPLHIMEHIEEKVHQRRTAKAASLHQPPPKKLQIIDMFDVISGTSTGGIIALALTECNMTVTEVKDFYLKKVSGLFNAGWLHKKIDTVWRGAAYHSEPLEKLMKSVANRPSDNKLSRWVTPNSHGPRVTLTLTHSLSHHSLCLRPSVCLSSAAGCLCVVSWCRRLL